MGSYCRRGLTLKKGLTFETIQYCITVCLSVWLQIASLLGISRWAHFNVKLLFLSPPVLTTPWAPMHHNLSPMHHNLSVCPSVTKIRLEVNSYLSKYCSSITSSSAEMHNFSPSNKVFTLTWVVQYLHFSWTACNTTYCTQVYERKTSSGNYLRMMQIMYILSNKKQVGSRQRQVAFFFYFFTFLMLWNTVTLVGKYNIMNGPQRTACLAKGYLQ